MGRILINDFKLLRQAYRATKYPIVLCHGLFGFDAYKMPTGKMVEYFSGIRTSLQARNAEVVVMPVPPVAVVELRAQKLYEEMNRNAVIRKSRYVNIIAHSMGGLDARYMLNQLVKHSDPIQIASLTTLSTPHRGSPIADLFETVSKKLPAEMGAFYQLTTKYMNAVFNKQIIDTPGVKYFSFGAQMRPNPLSPFYLTNAYISRCEGPNDGMVSVKSARWGEYMGTMDNVDHADIINMPKPAKLRNADYCAEAMYLHIMDDLAKMGY